MSSIYNLLRFSRDKIKYIIRKHQYRDIHDLEVFYNIHKNNRCFIIGTGPSLTMQDIDLVRNEITFSCNTITRVFNKTSWRPTYYGIVDKDVFAKLDIDLLKDLNCVFYYALFNYPYKNGHKILSDTSYHHLHFTRLLDEYPFLFSWTKFSSDITKNLYDGRTVVYVLLQIAIYMGFNEIYLLGCDTNYEKKNMYSKVIESEMTYSPKYQSAAEAMIECYKVAKDYADSNNIKIYNATRGGMLEVFPRVRLEDII